MGSKSPRGYIKLVGVMQKYIDQAISANTSYNPNFFPDRLISIKTLLEDLLLCYKYGLKTGYYFNTNDVEDNDDDDCDSCKI
jgi:ribonucleoside-diphosphate reductase alpha chain